jgi:hypothetical protein
MTTGSGEQRVLERGLGRRRFDRCVRRPERRRETVTGAEKTTPSFDSPTPWLNP